MNTTIVGIFNTRDEADLAAKDVKEKGLRFEDISIVAKQTDDIDSDLKNDLDHRIVNDNISDGTTTGGILGGLTGLLIGASTFALPGIGIISAAGPISGLLFGTVSGGVLGGLIDLGISEEETVRYTDTVSTGKVMFLMRTPTSSIPTISNILRSHGAIEVTTH